MAWRVLLFVSMVGWATFVFGQVPIGGSGVLVLASPPVVGLHFNATRTPGGAAVAGTQEADFDVVAVPYGFFEGTTFDYHWIPEESSQPVALGVLVFDPGSNGASATGRAYFTGEYQARCEVTIHEPGQPSLAATYVCPCFSFGGPLALSVENARFPNAPQHDLDREDKPRYLQYFGYDPTLPQPPDFAQQVQRGNVASFSQLEGVTYEWTVPAGLSLISHNGESMATSSALKVAGNAGSAAGALRVKLKYKYIYQGASYSVEDDSDETFPPGKNKANAAYYTFTCHAPADTSQVGGTIRSGGSPATGSQDYWETDYYSYKLVDNVAQDMPLVWVTERWVGEIPADFEVASPLLNWTTTKEPVGVFDLPDTLSSGHSATPFLSTGPPLYGPWEHDYVAGTYSPNPSHTGIIVGRYRLSIWTNWTKNDRIVN